MTLNLNRPIYLFTLCCSLLFYSTTNHATPSEYALKAAFIEKFSHFIKWPPNSSAYKPDSDFNICISGKNPFGGVLQKIADISRINNKIIRIKKISHTNKIADCHILFISHKSNSTLRKILDLTRGKPVLTISDNPGYAKQGVIINFYPRKQSIGFEINRQAAITSQLTISSRLLKLARIVESNGENP